MNNKILTTICIAGAVVAAAIAAIVVTNNRAAIARAQAAKAESREATAKSEAKKAKAVESAATAKAAVAKAEAEKAKAEEKTAQANAAAEKDRAIAEEAAQKTAEMAAQKARDEANAAADLRAAAKAEAEKAKAAAEAVRIAETAEVAKSNALAQAESDRLAVMRIKTEKALAEARMLENRKIDFETWQSRLLELEQELAERERALTPDISINDSTNIVWVGEREADVIGGDTNTLSRLRRKRVAPENDRSLPESTRRLARMEREMRAQFEDGMSSSSNKIVKALTRLYVQAVRDGRLLDAAYYRRSLKYYNPNWEYKAP